MTVNHDAVAALPTGSAASKTLTRTMTVKRFPYSLTDAESSLNLVAVDPDTGAIPSDLVYLGRVFHYDAADTTTAHDGTTCLVSSEGKRYKLASGTDVLAWSVKSASLTAPPGSPTIGDAYLVATAATGAWASKDGKVAIYTARGWEFVTFGIGRLVYDETTDSYYRKKPDGSWTSGFGTQAVGSNSVRPSALINAGIGYIIKIENQTTNSPPGSPSSGNAYIVGPSPTGAWAGKSGNVAIYIGGAWDYYVPVAGDTVYDKSAKNNYVYSGTSWGSFGGAIVGFSKTSTAAATGMTGTAGSTFGWTGANNPSTATHAYSLDTSTTISYAAKKAGNILKITYIAHGYGDFDAGNFTLAILRDSETAPLDHSVTTDNGQSRMVRFEFYITTADALPHTYKAAFFGGNASYGGLTGLSVVYKRTMIIEEIAQ